MKSIIPKLSLRPLKAARSTLFFVTAALVISVPVSGAAQARTATVVGQISDRTTSTALANAQVIVGTDGRSATTDSVGRFALGGLNPGPNRLVVRADGFPVVSFPIELTNGDTLIQVIRLDSTAQGRAGVQELPEVPITAKATLGPRYADFERRLKTGRGQYLTLEQIEKGRYGTVQEAIRMMRGVEFACGGGSGCFVRMARAPMQCLPEYIVDDRVDSMFGPRTPIRDVQGIEVYTGPSDVPGEYAGRNAGCGVIVIWTKSGPPPPRRRP